jgi:hypothetical protein
MMNKITALAGAAVGLALAAPANAADYYLFELSGAYTASWTIAVGTPADATDVGTTGFFNVQGSFPGHVQGHLADIYFYDDIDATGGFSIVDFWADPANGGVATHDFDGPQIFDGTLLNPTFFAGSYALTDFNDPNSAFTLTITECDCPPPAVPEPTTWAMMIAGFGIVGGAMRARTSKVKYTKKLA